MTHLHPWGEAGSSRRRNRLTGSPTSRRSRRRLLFEPLEERQLLATLAVATHTGVFDSTSPAPHAEVANLLAELAAQGHAAVPFADLSASSISAALAGTAAVIIPEQELASLDASLTEAARAVLRDYVDSGRGMIVTGSPDGRAEGLLASLFGIPLTPANNPGGSFFRQDAPAAGTAFATAPTAVNNNMVQTTAFDIATYPAGFPADSKLLYTSGSVANVALFPFGQGEIVYYAYDFDNPASNPTRATNWKGVLAAAIEQVAASAASTSLELVSGNLLIRDLAGANDAFLLTANDQAWTITMTSGLFGAPAPIPGVTINLQSIVIDKVLATTFTGNFEFAGGDGNDVLRVVLDDIDRGVHFDGGESAGDHDLLEIAMSAAVDSLTSAPNLHGGGTIDIGQGGLIEVTYAGLEPVDLTGILADELHLVVPAGISTAELIDHLAPTDSLSQLRFNGAGPEDQYFRHPATRLAIHTSGDTTVGLFPLDPTATIPHLLLNGSASDTFRFGATTGIRGGTSLTLVDATLDLNGQSPVIDGLSGSGLITNLADTPAVLTLGSSGGSGDFDGSIIDGWPAGPVPPANRQVSLYKTGSGEQRLTGLNTYSGLTTVAEGTLLLDGSLSPHSAVTIQSDATLRGTGSVQGTLLVESGATIAPGSVGITTGTLAGNHETWQAGSQLLIELGGTIPGGEFDQRLIGGSLTINDAELSVSLISGFRPTNQPPIFLTIVENTGSQPINGQFLNLPEGAQTDVPGSPVPLFITYAGGTGNDVVLFTLPDVSQILGTPGDDTIVLRRQGAGASDGELAYSLNGSPFVPLSGVDSMTIDAGSGADLVVLDFIFGEPVPPAGLELIGGDEPAASAGDRLVLLGTGDGTNATYFPGTIPGQQGSMQLSGIGNGTIALVGWEAIDATALARFALQAQLGASQIEITDGVDAGTQTHPALRMAGVTGHVTLVPVNVWAIEQLVVDALPGPGDDDVTIHSASGNHAVAALHVTTGAGADQLVIAGNAAFSGDVHLESGDIHFGATLSSGPGNSVVLEATGLIDGSGPAIDVIATRLHASATQGIDLDTEVEEIVLANASHGDVRLENFGPMSLGSTGTVSGLANLAPAASVEVINHGLLRVNRPVAAQAQVILTTVDEPGLDADLSVEAPITSHGANVVLQSADNAIIRGPISSAITIDLAIDTNNSDPGEGNTLFLQAPLFAPGGVTATGNADADRFEMQPQTSAAIVILGELPTSPQADPATGNASRGNGPGDKLVLDMTSAGNGQTVIGPVLVDTNGGRVTAANTLPITYRGIEDLDLLDGEKLTTVQQGDFYVRGTDLDENIVVNHNGHSDPSFRVSINGISYPQGATFFGPYGRGRSMVVYARGGRDYVQLGSTPLRAEFYGEGGDDSLYGAGFGDLLVGGAGRDNLHGGSQGGGDELWGDDFDPIPRDEDGHPLANPTPDDFLANRAKYSTSNAPTDGPDTLTTTGGDDQLYGQGGNDTLQAGAGNDFASGGWGNDLISGGDGDDRLYGNEGDDTLGGDAGHDLLSGGSGNDTLYGRLGNDVLIGGLGADRLNGNDGNDALFAGEVESESGASGEGRVRGDARDLALLALLWQWSLLGVTTGFTSAGDDGELDWLYGHAGSDRFVGDGSQRNYDFFVGQDELG